MFGTRGIVPIGAAALAFMIGVTAGLLVRRTIPAMGLTLAVFAAALVAMPLWISPHLITPAQYTRPVVANLTAMQMTSSGQFNDPVTSLPGAWILTDQIITAEGKVFSLPQVAACRPAPRHSATPTSHSSRSASTSSTSPPAATGRSRSWKPPSGSSSR